MQLKGVFSTFNQCNLIFSKSRILTSSFSSMVTSYDKEIFARLRRDDPTLTSLSLSMSQIGPKGADFFAQAIQKNTHTKEVYLNNNRLLDDGIIRISNACKYNQALKVLDLSSNNITDVGAEALGAMIAKNTSLYVLILNNNFISNLGFEFIEQALSKNNVLQELHMINNKLCLTYINQLKHKPHSIYSLKQFKI